MARQVKQIVLIGARGAGKSAAGMRAARRLRLAFYDSDQLIVARAGLEISEIFARDGEQGFRTLERDVLLELFELPRALVSTGGGCVTIDEVYSRLTAHPGSVWLAAPAEVLASRVASALGRGDRPSLTGADPVEEIPAVLARREHLYRACAAHVLDATRSLEEVAFGIEQFWQELDDHDFR